MNAVSTKLAAVIIGRNEGERLLRCLASTLPHCGLVVYVDSGSTDDSVSQARARAVQVVELDMTLPFTAARARNAGWRLASSLIPDLQFVHFIDGDCEVVAGWIEQAQTFLMANPKVAAVCGRRRERFPDRSIYNQLCDIEWNTPPGQARACGGDALMRHEALQAVNGFREDLIAGEEPELCVRLRAAGWHIWRLDAEMTLHDAAMTRFSQWWKRSTRAGFAFAQGAQIHGAPPERHWVRESRSAWVWGLALPVAIMLAGIAISPWLFAMLLIYPLQALRLSLRAEGSWRIRLARGASLVVGKFAEALGQLRFWKQQWSGRRAGLIEYK